MVARLTPNVQADTVVLDVDGVLVDVSDSYRRAVVDTVERLFGTELPTDAIQPLKDAGGFNNDWLVTDALALYVCAGAHGYDATVSEYADSIARQGGGRDGARAVLSDALGDDYPAVEDTWDPEAVRATFQALYLGADRYRELEGGEPPFETTGYIDEEPTLVTPETLDRLTSRYTVGVLTGRPRAEAQIAAKRVGLELPDEMMLTMDDPPPGKPAPEPLELLARRADADSVVFVGDTLDDVRCAVNASDADPDRTYHGVGVLTGGLSGDAGREAFETAGAAAVLADVNELAEWLAS